MNYKEAIDYIHSTYRFGSKLGLENIQNLLEALGNPHKDLKVIHVAGTNGKGSTCAFIHSVLVAQGFKVGLYTSPYLETFNERIQINGKNIGDERLAELTDRVKTQVEILVKNGSAHPTEFEIVTAMAFCHFMEEAVDFLVLEVGMGGRLDATNVIENPLVSVITPLSLDHTQYLGKTLAEIAYEKGGIIKKNGLVVTATQPAEAEDVLVKIARDRGARLEIVKTYNYRIIRRSLKNYEFKSMALRFFKNMNIGLLGEHQIRNCILAVRVLELMISEYGLELEEDTLLKGLQDARWPGRLEVLMESPCLMIDGAHNLQGATILRNFMQYHFAPKKRRGSRLIGVLGILKDKDTAGIVEETVPIFDKLILTEPENERAMKVEDLMTLVQKHHECVDAVRDWRGAIGKALEEAGPEDIIMVFGSLYLVGQVRTFISRR